MQATSSGNPGNVMPSARNRMWLATTWGPFMGRVQKRQLSGIQRVAQGGQVVTVKGSREDDACNLTWYAHLYLWIHGEQSSQARVHYSVSQHCGSKCNLSGGSRRS